MGIIFYNLLYLKNMRANFVILLLVASTSAIRLSSNMWQKGDDLPPPEPAAEDAKKTEGTDKKSLQCTVAPSGKKGKDGDKKEGEGKKKEEGEGKCYPVGEA